MKEDFNKSELMKLFLNIEQGFGNYDIALSDRAINFFKDDNHIGSITYNFKPLIEGEFKPSINIGVINNESMTPHLGSYLMAYFILTNVTNLSVHSNITFGGFNNRRRGELEEIIKDSENEGTVGGPKSQLFHLNFIFQPQVNKESFGKLLKDLQSFDTSADFVSESNEDDSFFSILVTSKMNNWGAFNTENVYFILATAYNKFNKSLSYIRKYININNDFNRTARAASRIYRNRLKNSFISSYKSIYNQAINDFKVLRRKLKNELVNDYRDFINLINYQLLNLINPFDRDVHASYLNNIMNSRGMKELSYLTQNFNPERAGIPMPKPELVEQKFDLIIDYIKD